VVSSQEFVMSQLIADLEISDCSICYYPFSSEGKGEHTPRTLSCGHTLCHNCVHQLLQNSSRVRCPECKRLEQPVESASDFPVNWMMCRAAQQIGDARNVEKDPCCHLHTLAYSSFCVDCQELVCPECLSNEGPHHHHSSQTKEKAASALQNRLDDEVKLLASLREQCQGLQQSSASVITGQGQGRVVGTLLHAQNALLDLASPVFDVAQALRNFDAIMAEANVMKTLPITAMLFVSKDFHSRLVWLHEVCKPLIESGFRSADRVDTLCDRLDFFVRHIRQNKDRLLEAQEAKAVNEQKGMELLGEGPVHRPELEWKIYKGHDLLSLCRDNKHFSGVVQRVSDSQGIAGVMAVPLSSIDASDDVGFVVRVDHTAGRGLTIAVSMFNTDYAPSSRWVYQYGSTGLLKQSLGVLQSQNWQRCLASPYGDGDMIGVRLNRSAGTVAFYKNGVLQGQTSPLNVTGWVPMVLLRGQGQKVTLL